MLKPLQVLERIKVEFLANASQELRPPLAVVLRVIEALLAKPSDEISPASRTSLEVAHLNALKLLKWVDAFDEFDKRDAVSCLLERDEGQRAAVVDGGVMPAACHADAAERVLSEVMLPVLNGFELLKRLREDEQTTAMPVVLLSAHPEKAPLIAASAIDDHLAQPRRAREDDAARHEADQASQPGETQFRDILEHAPIGMALLSLEGRFTQVNRAFCEIMGYESEELLKLSFISITHPDDLQQDHDFVLRMEAGEIRSYEMEKRYIRKDGRIVWGHLTGSLLSDDKGAASQVIKQVQDITGRKEVERLLKIKAHTDYLTGVASRGRFFELAEQELIRSRRYDCPLSLAMLDLDHFKAVNDSHGHQAGDTVLKELSSICRHVLREVDVVGRVGGEEFAILLPETDGEPAFHVIERLREAIAATEVTLQEGLALHFTASLGIATLTPVDADINTLLNRADQALYQAKCSGRNRTCKG